MRERGTEAPTGAPSLPPVAESLLAPLLQWTGEALREFKAQDLPPALRPLLGFDRRGFGSAAARAQVRKALETEHEFRAQVFEAVSERAEPAAMLRDWDSARALDLARAAEARDDLPLLASALVVARPPGWEFGVGVVTGIFERSLEERAAEDDRRAFDTQVAKAQEARRRAEDEASGLRAEVERVGAELREERASRREREEAVRGEGDDARRRVAELETAVAQARDEAARSEERAGREAQRASGLEAELRAARTDAARARAEAEETTPPGSEMPAAEAAHLSPEDVEVLARAGEIARRIVPGAEPEGPVPPAPSVPEDTDERPALTRRVPVELPPGVIGPSLEGLREAFRRGDPAVIVDGYNVSMLAWGDEAPDAQRQRLCASLERLHLRTNRSITVVFDGADVVGVRPPRRPGVRVLFSAPGEEADEVVVREARSLPFGRPAIVVSSDKKVQEGAEHAGALAVPSDVFVEFLRK